jgi:hypothetical protein
MDSAVHNGYADILVTETSWLSISVADKDGQCHDKPGNHEKHSYRLGYDGKSYPVPEALRPLG